MSSARGTTLTSFIIYLSPLTSEVYLLVNLLQWENDCHHHNFFSFDWMFQKLTGKGDMDEISDKFENWPD